MLHRGIVLSVLRNRERLECSLVWASAVSKAMPLVAICLGEVPDFQRLPKSGRCLATQHGKSLTAIAHDRTFPPGSTHRPRPAVLHGVEL